MNPTVASENAYTGKIVLEVSVAAVARSKVKVVQLFWYRALSRLLLSIQLLDVLKVVRGDSLVTGDRFHKLNYGFIPIDCGNIH